MVRIPFMFASVAAAVLAGTYIVGTTPSGVAQSPKWRALLEPAAGARARGGAMVEAKDTGTRFTITIRNAPANTTLAWHMHSGTCAAPGAVVGSGYPELKVGPGGTAEAAVTLSVAAPAGAAFVIQVHDPTGTPISCGELKLIGAQ